MKYNYETVTIMKCNRLIYIDLMDLHYFGASSVLPEDGAEAPKHVEAFVI
jgi:hypothetical protein